MPRRGDPNDKSWRRDYQNAIRDSEDFGTDWNREIRDASGSQIRIGDVTFNNAGITIGDPGSDNRVRLGNGRFAVSSGDFRIATQDGQRPVTGPYQSGGYNMGGGNWGVSGGGQQYGGQQQYRERSMDLSGPGDIDVNYVGNLRTSDVRNDPDLAIRALLEAQKNDPTYGAPDASAQSVDYIGDAEVTSFKGNLADREEVTEFLAERLNEVASRSPQRSSLLFNEVRRQFGDDMAADVLSRTNGVPREQAMALLSAQPIETGAGPQQGAAQQVDPAAVTRVQQRIDALRGIATDPETQDLVDLQTVYPGMSTDQLQALQRMPALLETPKADGSMPTMAEVLADNPDIAAATAALTQQQQQLVSDLANVDQATREQFLTELAQDNASLASELRTQTEAQIAAQGQGSAPTGNMLTTEQLQSIHFNDEATQTRYEAAVRSYEQIASLPMIGPILNMFMESFGMGPHSIIRENADQIDRISQEALEAIGPATNPVRANIENNPGLNITTEAPTTDVEPPTTEDPTLVTADALVTKLAADAPILDVREREADAPELIADADETALAAALGLEDHGLDEKGLTEAASIAATLGGEDIDASDGIDGNELAKIQALMNGPLGAAIQGALKESDVTYDGVANDDEVRAAHTEAVQQQQAAGLGQ